MIATFTNSRGEVNRGVVLDVDESGLLQIRWQPFYQLIERIVKRNPGERELAEKTLGDRIGWSRPRQGDESGASLVVVPETGDSPELTAKFKMFGMVTNASL